MTADQHLGKLPPGRSRDGVPDLRELVRIARFQASVWLGAMAPEDAERPQVERLRDLTEQLLSGETIRLIDMEQLRKQLCECCRRLNAGKNFDDCKGRALGHCPILIELAEK